MPRAAFASAREVRAPRDEISERVWALVDELEAAACSDRRAREGPRSSAGDA